MIPIVTHALDALAGKHPIGVMRSDQWPKVRKTHLASHPTCELCGGEKKLEVHHMRPFHLHPELELEPSNLITLCEADKGGATYCSATWGISRAGIQR